MGKSSINGPFSMPMLNNLSVQDWEMAMSKANREEALAIGETFASKTIVIMDDNGTSSILWMVAKSCTS